MCYFFTVLIGSSQCSLLLDISLFYVSESNDIYKRKLHGSCGILFIAIGPYLLISVGFDLR